VSQHLRWGGSRDRSLTVINSPAFVLRRKATSKGALQQMSARFVSQTLGLSAGLLLCLTATLEAASFSKLATRGKIILQEKCGRCHAIEPVGESPLKKAPPMRDIYDRYNPRELRAELIEGKVSKHREMPQIAFSDEDTYAILTYLHALAVRK
jgi:cytochrome c553